MGELFARRRYPDLSPRNPSGSALHAVLREHLETFLAERERADAPLPRFVTDELRGALDCGVLAKGCAHFRCESCGVDRVVARSCKGRGFCPRCCGHHMNETARHLVERVFPEVRNAEVAVAAHDTERREALLRYFLRPPLPYDRLRYLPSNAHGTVILQLKKPWQDRTTHVELTPSAFLARLASLVPRPKKNWAALMKHSFWLDVLGCPTAG